MKKALALVLALLMSLALLTACGGNNNPGGNNSDPGGGNAGSGVPSYASLKVGEDYTDITAELRVITHRTDIIDTTFAKL